MAPKQPKQVFLKRGEGTSRFARGGMAEARNKYLEKHPGGLGSSGSEGGPRDAPWLSDPDPSAQESAWAAASVRLPSAPTSTGSALAPVAAAGADDDIDLVHLRSPMATDPRRASAEADVSLDEFEALEATVREQAEAMVHASGLSMSALDGIGSSMRPASAMSNDDDVERVPLGGSAPIFDEDEYDMGGEQLAADEEEASWMAGYEDEEDVAQAVGLPPPLPDLPPAPPALSMLAAAAPPASFCVPSSPIGAEMGVSASALSPEHPDDDELSAAAEDAAAAKEVAALAAADADANAAAAADAGAEEDDVEPLSWSLVASSSVRRPRGLASAAAGDSGGAASAADAGAELWSAYSIFNNGGVGSGDGGGGDGAAVGGEAGGETFLYADYDDEGYAGAYASAPAPPPTIDPSEPPPTSQLVSYLFKQPPPPSQTREPPSRPPSSAGGRGGCGGGGGIGRGGGGIGRGGGVGGAGGPEGMAAAAAEEETRRLRRKVQQLGEQLGAAISAKEQAETLLRQQLEAAAVAAGGGAAPKAPLSLADAGVLQEEMRRFEAYKAEEGRKLVKERRVLERQAKALLKVPDRKEREELESAKAEVAALKKELQVRAALNASDCVWLLSTAPDERSCSCRAALLRVYACACPSAPSLAHSSGA